MRNEKPNVKLNAMITAMTLVLALIPHTSFGNAESCGKKIYSGGWLKKYEFKGNTLGANTKKSGLLGSSTGAFTENTTSSVDPGVTTGQFISSAQYSSSWGECAAVDLIITKSMRDGYIKQNLPEIKKQVAMGKGYLVDSLATLSGCKNIDHKNWSRKLQSHTSELYDSQSGDAFRDILDGIIVQDPELKTNCHLSA